jgi:hypothetical protein
MISFSRVYIVGIMISDFPSFFKVFTQVVGCEEKLLAKMQEKLYDVGLLRVIYQENHP